MENGRISNPRLLRAMKALRRSAGRNRRGLFARALLESTLLFEARRPMKDVERVVFTDVAAYRHWASDSLPKRALHHRKAVRLLEEFLSSRTVDAVTINPGSPDHVRLSVEGAALVLRPGYPVFWI